MTRNKQLDIVVVDDNPVLVSVISEIFCECGHSVRAVSDGFVALAEIRKGVPDILLSDLCMPGMSGYELLSVVRRRFPTIRVIAMSGAFSGGKVPHGIAADAFYAKGSSSVAQLIEIVSSIWREEAHLPRSVTPVWIAEIAKDHPGASLLLVSCPECLRPFARRADRLELLPWKDSCPHCMTVVELTLVRQTHGTDGTPISLEAVEEQMRQATTRARWNDLPPTGRMHQQ
jgi:CheY-like chemotaxis protein